MQKVSWWSIAIPLILLSIAFILVGAMGYAMSPEWLSAEQIREHAHNAIPEPTYPSAPSGTQQVTQEATQQACFQVPKVEGFPSPLLDWTKSPYVAAYFAFARTKAAEVAVYVLDERPNKSKVRSSDRPQIISFGPYIKTHRRHFRQQSRYTICTKFEGNEWMFVPHDLVLETEGNQDQDLLWKIIIPAKERQKILRHFDKFNLNEFTLFESEEGLLEMLAMREFDLRPGSEGDE
jgi:hypothetical protein